MVYYSRFKKPLKVGSYLWGKIHTKPQPSDPRYLNPVHRHQEETLASANSTGPWQSVPRKTVVIFLLAVFFVFAGVGFANDTIDMGRQPPLRFGIAVFLTGCFSIAYAYT